MAKWIANVYTSVADLHAAIELIDNTVTIHIVPYKEGSKQLYLLIQAT